MLFSDEPRFKSKVTTSDGSMQGYRKVSSTDRHIGPGAYFMQDNEESRGGWVKKSFSIRQPMSPPEHSPNSPRNEYYTQSVMLSNGLLISPGKSSGRLRNPGPGQYSFLTTIDRSVRSTSRPSSAPSSRFPPNRTIVHRGVIVQASARDNEMINLGPGQYEVGRESFNKRSFNVRASQNIPPGNPYGFKSVGVSSNSYGVFASPGSVGNRYAASGGGTSWRNSHRGRRGKGEVGGGRQESVGSPPQDASKR